MAQIAKVIAKAEVKSSPAKFYDFFKNNMAKLPIVTPHILKRAEIVEGEEGQVGNVKLCEYVIGKKMVIKVKATKLDDQKRSITLEAVEGDVMQTNPGFKTTITMGEGFVEWCIQCEATAADGASVDSSSGLDAYGKVDVEITKAVDAYLLSH